MLNQQDIQDRRIRAAVREYDQLTRRRFTVVKLEEPIQRGWRRTYAMTEQALRRHDSETLAEILAVINTVKLCRRSDFQTHEYRGRRLVEIEQPLRFIHDREWYRCGLPERWFGYFDIRHYSEWGRPAFRADFAFPKLFELRIEPYMVSELALPDPSIETRIEELRRFLDLKGGWNRWYHLKGKPVSSCYFSRGRRTQILEREHRNTILNAMRGEVESNAPEWCVRFNFQRTKDFPNPAWFTGNSRLARLRSDEPWECNSPRRDHFRKQPLP